MVNNEEYIVLNEIKDGHSSVEGDLDPLILSKKLVALILKLKGLNFIDEKSIDYKNLIENDLFKLDFVNLVQNLQSINLNKLVENDENSDKNVLAFFINIYNTLTIHALCYLHEQNLIKDSNLLGQVEGKFWSRMSYKIDAYTFSLDDIEHGILRSNRVHPTKNSQFFTNDDLRLKFCVKNFDPRIHFALNCGAKGCPPISFYTPENVERGLSLASVSFCTNETQVNLQESKVVLSRLFMWYGLDFVTDSTHKDEQLLEFVGKNLRDQVKEDFDKLINKHESIKIEYSNYDWEINKK